MCWSRRICTVGVEELDGEKFTEVRVCNQWIEEQGCTSFPWFTYPSWELHNVDKGSVGVHALVMTLAL